MLLPLTNCFVVLEDLLVYIGSHHEILLRFTAVGVYPAAKKCLDITEMWFRFVFLKSLAAPQATGIASRQRGTSSLTDDGGGEHAMQQQQQQQQQQE